MLPKKIVMNSQKIHDVHTCMLQNISDWGQSSIKMEQNEFLIGYYVATILPPPFCCPASNTRICLIFVAILLY